MAGWPLIPHLIPIPFIKIVIPAILKALHKPISATTWYNVCTVVSPSYTEFMYHTTMAAFTPKFKRDLTTTLIMYELSCFKDTTGYVDVMGIYTSEDRASTPIANLYHLNNVLYNVDITTFTLGI